MVPVIIFLSLHRNKFNHELNEDFTGYNSRQPRLSGHLNWQKNINRKCVNKYSV